MKPWFEPTQEQIDEAIAAEHRPITPSIIVADLRDANIRVGLARIVRDSRDPHVQMLAQLLQHRRP